MAWKERNLLNRRYASDLNQRDAFVGGYFFVFFEVPTKVGPVYQTLFSGMQTPNSVQAEANAEDMSLMLSALTTGVPTIPDTTINQNSMPGLGGTKWGVATNIDHPTTVGFKFRELSGLPVCKCIAAWYTMMRDPHAGTSLLHGDDYTKKEFSGSATLAYTKPDGITIEMATRFEGIYPVKYPSDLFTSDVATVDPLEPDIDFHVDSIWSDKEAWLHAETIIKNAGQDKPYHTGNTASMYAG